MAIQNRRGVYTDFDASKMVAGEFAVVQSGDPDSSNGTSLYISFQSGTVKRIILADDLDGIIGSLDDLETTDKTNIINAINEISEKATIYHGVTSTSGATRDKVVVCSDFELKDGVYIAVDFSQNNTATNARLDVNNTGAKSIVASENSYVTDWIIRGSTYLFRFEDDALGGAYYLIGATERIPSDSTPIMNGTAASGTSKQYARADHVHPTDTSRASNEDLEQLETALETKAEIDGYYEDMTVGDAEQLVGTQFVEDSVPYLYRTSGGSADIGNREYDEIVGGSVVWNSLARFNQSDIPSADNGITYSYTDGNSVLLNGTVVNTGARTGWFGLIETVGLDLSRYGHKLLVMPKLLSGSITDGNISFTVSTGIYSVKVGNSKIGILNYTNTNQIRGSIILDGGTVCTNAKITIICVDLTAMFGSAVADYLYTLDSATAGAGVAKLKSWGFLQKDYYEYNAGTMMHVSGISAHEMVGFNQWDEEWEVGGINYTTGQNGVDANRIRSKNYISVFPSTTYYATCSTTSAAYSAYWYDAEKNYIKATYPTMNGTFVSPENARYMRFTTPVAYGTTYNHDICINLSWSGTRNGEYEPYVKHTYPLDSSLTLRGIPKLDASNNLYYDGDTYAADGTVTRKYGIVDLGTLPWSRMSESYQYGTFSATYSGMRYSTSVNTFVCSKYEASNNSDVSASSDNVIWNRSGAVVVKDTSKASVTASDFKAAMSGVYLVYELATPTTETATPYRSLQKVDPYGTEEYVSTSLVPVGHYTKYPENLRAKIENLDLSMIAPIETGTTASQAYAVGKYFLLNNKFCKAKTAIASGATFTLNTNYEVTTIADELYTALNA